MSTHELMVGCLIEELKKLSADSDKEAAMSKAEKLILKFLSDIDYEDVAKAYEDVLNMSW